MSGLGDQYPASEAPTGAIDRALMLLLAVAGAGEARTVRELSDASGINRSTTHRILGTLERHGFVEKDVQSSGYRLGWAAVRLANAVDGPNRLLRIARSEMDHLRDIIKETVTLTIVNDLELVVTSAVYPEYMMRPMTVTGRVLPLHATSMGKVVLAELEPAMLDEVLHDLEVFTATTPTAASLLEELPGIREQGYAASAGEFEEGLNGVSAPIRDQFGVTVAGLTAVGPSYRLSVNRLDEVGLLLAAAAERVGQRVSGPFETNVAGPLRRVL